MNRINLGGPKLPSALLDQIGSTNDNGASNPRNRKHSQLLGRTERRKALRQEKKQQKRPQQAPVRQRQFQHKQPLDSEHDVSDVVKSNPRQQTTRPQQIAMEESKLVLKKGKTRSQQGASPEPIKAPISRAVKAKLKEDDAEIAALEKKLGMKGKKLPKVFDDDGLGDLLDGLDEDDDSMFGKRKRSEYDEFLSSKRRHVEGSDLFPEDELGDDFAFSEDEGSEMSGLDFGEAESDLDEDSTDGNGEFDGFDDDMESQESKTDQDLIHSESKLEEQPPNKRRENPYVAPTAPSVAPAAKYVPPSMRGTPTSESEELIRLRRQLQGLLNRLSEANMISILRDIETIYASHPRQHVTEILIGLLMSLLCDRTTLMDTFIILHAGFAAATYKVIGAHFGAQLLERIVSDFERLYEVEKSVARGSKETTNLIALLAELYTFQLVGSNLVFDYIRLFLADLTELNTELLLKIIKNCGTQLRHDDPSSLKDIVIMLQTSVAKIGESNLPVRTKFMIETINNLKNNRQKTGVVASTMAAEHTARMKKTIGVLNIKAKASEPLGVSLADIKSSSKEGKWWLVGASWKNDVQRVEIAASTAQDGDGDDYQDDIMHTRDDNADLLQLAKEQRMNTDIRRAIFMNIMSASDYKDAHMRLTKLKLKKAQDLEIPRVLIHCAGAEKGYNPYYTLIAKRLCTEHRFKWAMQYGLWDLFKRMGEKSDNSDEADVEMEEEGDETIDLRKIVNLGRMYGQLIADDALSLSSLKILNFAYLLPKTKTFLEILLATAFKQSAKRSKDASTDASDLDSAITTLIMRARGTAQVITGLQFFLSKQVNAEELASNSAERKILKKALRTAKRVLVQLSSSLS